MIIRAGRKRNGQKPYLHDGRTVQLHLAPQRATGEFDMNSDWDILNRGARMS